jgi:hypothetical protein
MVVGQSNGLRPESRRTTNNAQAMLPVQTKLGTISAERVISKVAALLSPTASLSARIHQNLLRGQAIDGQKGLLAQGGVRGRPTLGASRSIVPAGRWLTDFSIARPAGTAPAKRGVLAVFGPILEELKTILAKGSCRRFSPHRRARVTSVVRRCRSWVGIQGTREFRAAPNSNGAGGLGRSRDGRNPSFQGRGRGTLRPSSRSDEVITQLSPPLPMETSKGGGWAHFVIDYGPEAALLWVVFMDADGACWTVPNSEVRMTFNWTMGRRKPEVAEEREKPTERQPQPLRPVFPRAAE